jgi:hypothetical protein
LECDGLERHDRDSISQSGRQTASLVGPRAIHLISD